MIFPLDHWLFGSGWGMKSPYCDDRYYWLVDTSQKERSGRNGQLYTFSAGFGAQLTSYQWTHPKPGERRRLCNYDFVAFNSHRCGPRVSVSWAATEMDRLDLNQQRRFLDNLRDDLNSVLIERNYWRDKAAQPTRRYEAAANWIEGE